MYIAYRNYCMYPFSVVVCTLSVLLRYHFDIIDCTLFVLVYAPFRQPPRFASRFDIVFFRCYQVLRIYYE